jgi:TPR repeat protein
MFNAKGRPRRTSAYLTVFLGGFGLALALHVLIAVKHAQARDPLWEQLPWDERVGLGWYEAQGAKGDAEAQFRAGRLHELGVDTPADPQAARRWYERAAKQGHPQAAYRLALMLQNGRGGPRDMTRAAEFYAIAAQQGVVQAEYNLGVLKQLGIGVVQDREGAVRLYRRAAKQGYAPAALALAQLLAVGWKDHAAEPVRALAWAILAEAMGAPDASELRRQIAADLTESEVARARELAEDWPQ